MTQALSRLPSNRGASPATPPAHEALPDLTEVHGLLTRAYSMITGMLDRLRESRTLLEDATVQKIQDTSAKLHEVTSATETATTDILDGLDRTLLLIDRLENGAPAAEIAAALRDEIFGAMNHLQFQDITTQQLHHAASLLHEMEGQLLEFARIFDPTTHPDVEAAVAAGARHAAPVAFDPAATTRDAASRQALVDELLNG